MAFIDEIKIHAEAGRGGNGVQRGRPGLAQLREAGSAVHAPRRTAAPGGQRPRRRGPRSGRAHPRSQGAAAVPRRLPGVHVAVPHHGQHVEEPGPR